MTARRDIRIPRGDDYAHVIVFDADQSANSFEAFIDELADDVVEYATSTSGASVTLSLAASVTAELSDASHTWKVRRSVGGVKSTILSGNVIVED